VITPTFNPVSLSTALFRVFFGLCGCVAEMRWTGMLQQFQLLTSFIGLGSFYVFLGGFAAGNEWYELAGAFAAAGQGLFYILLGGTTSLQSSAMEGIKRLGGDSKESALNTAVAANEAGNAASDSAEAVGAAAPDTAVKDEDDW
jgi:hypothetical protein